MLLLRAWLFYLGLIASTLFIVPLCLIIWPLPFAKRYFFVTRWTAFNLWWLKITCNLKHTIEGSDNIPKTASIIMCKHQSVWETLAVQLIFPAQVWVLKRELLWIPIYGWGLASMQPIAIKRASAVRSARQIVKQGCQRLASGLWIVIFPEGTRTAPGERKKYRPGGGMLAEQSGAQIVPVAHNAGYFWPRNAMIKKPGTIRLVIGPAIRPQGKTATEIMAEVETWIENTANNLPAPSW